MAQKPLTVLQYLVSSGYLQEIEEDEEAETETEADGEMEEKG